VCDDRSMNEQEINITEEIAGRVGRLQAEILCIENFLDRIANRDDIPAGIKSGAEYYLKSINERREAGDI
jgi:hypothetical protein